MSRPRRFPLAALTLAASACAAASPSLIRAPAGPPLELSIPDGRGGTLDLADLRGRVVLLDLFASWCEPCRYSLPFYASLAERHAEEGLVLVAVSLDTEEAPLRQFLERVAPGLPVLRDATGEVAERLQPKALPTLFVLDREGRLRLHHTSFRQADRAPLEAFIRELLQ